MRNKLDLAWLAGIVDGEGNIGFEKRRSITIRLVITNTSDIMINNILRIYKNLGITNYCRKRKRFCNDNFNRKPCYDIQVHRIREIQHLLKLLIPYLINKKEKAIMVLKYCNIRIKKLDTGKKENLHYGLEELQIVDEIYKLNKRGIQ